MGRPIHPVKKIFFPDPHRPGAAIGVEMSIPLGQPAIGLAVSPPVP